MGEVICWFELERCLGWFHCASLIKRIKSHSSLSDCILPYLTLSTSDFIYLSIFYVKCLFIHGNLAHIFGHRFSAIWGGR